MLARWLGDGRGHALRHLGWTDLIAEVARHLQTDMARARVRDELTAIELLLDDRLGEPDHARITEDHGPGVAAALQRLPSLRPEITRADAAARLDELRGIEALRSLSDEHGGVASRIEAALGQLEDLDESLRVARGGAQLSVVELIGVAELCRACEAIVEAFTELRRATPEADGERARGVRACATRLIEVAGEVGEVALERPVRRCPELLATLDRSIDRRSDEPQIASNASPALAQARKQVRAAKQQLQHAADRLLRSPAVAESLRDAYWTERDGRIVLPIRSDRLGAVRGGGAIIHGSSASGHTFYVEPASLVGANNALREAELAAAEQERAILRALSAEVAGAAGALLGMQRACVALDLMLARQRFGAALGGRIPELAPEPGADRAGLGGEPEPAIELRAARHPAMLLDEVDVVPNDIVLERGHALVISGPNAGGKTVALETLGVLALLAAAGFALPCEGRARVPVFARVITDIGDDQSIAANLSTFSAHVAHVIEALRAAERESGDTLVLLDEVAVGTDPEQGAALAEAILVALVESGATVVATTHYDRLKLLATQPETGARFHNAAVGFDLARMRPTFRLSLGVPGSSSAIAVARRLGLSERVLARAEALLGDEGVKIDELLRDIEAERQSLARTRERLEREQLHLQRRDREVRLRERRMLDGVHSRRAKAYAAAAEQLHALEVELKSKRKRLRRADPERVEQLPTRAQLAGEARTQLAAHRAEAEAEAELEQGSTRERLDPRSLTVGMRVRIPSMKQDGEIVALVGSPAKRATVQLQTLRTTVKVAELGPPLAKLDGARIKRGKAEPILDFAAAIDEQAAAHFGDSPRPLEAGVDSSCDVRGLRFEDAQERVADFVAQALARDQDVILVRHGHGGGALRRAVREILGRLDRVRRQRPGLPVEGGDAVTIAWLE